MKTLIGIFIISFLAVGCAGAPPFPGVDLTDTMEQLQSLNKESLETKRKFAKMILENWEFDGAFWARIFEETQMRPDSDTVRYVTELNLLAVEYNTVDGDWTDTQYGDAFALYLLIIRGVIQHAVKEVLPQITQLLSLL